MQGPGKVEEIDSSDRPCNSVGLIRLKEEEVHYNGLVSENGLNWLSRSRWESRIL